MNRGTLPAIERNLFLPALAGFFIAGIWLGKHVGTGLWPLWLAVAALLSVFPLRWLRLPLRLACLPLGLMLALFWTQHWLNPAIPAEGEYQTIIATVYGDSGISESGNTTFRLCDISLNGEAQRGKAYGYVYTQDGEDPVQLTDGMRIRFSGTVYKPYPKENEYDFDFPMWLYEQGMGYGISSGGDVEILSSETPWTDYAQRIARLCHERLQAVMGEKADLAVAMLLGYRDELDEEDAQAFRLAGVAHVMAVSGLHVGILSMALVWVLERLRLRKRWQIPVVAVFLLLYCGITGFAVSSLRAAVTVLLWTVGRAFGRKPNPLTVISAALLIVLIINPLQLFSAGFTLSFSAITGIALLYPGILRGLECLLPMGTVKKRKPMRRAFSRLGNRARQALAVSLSAQLGVLLPIAMYYHAVYPYGLLFNLMIVPMAGILVPLYAVTTLIVWIPWLAGWLGTALGAVSALGTEAMLRLVRMSNMLPSAEIRVAQPDVWTYLAYFAAMITVSPFVRAKATKRLTVIACVAVVAAAGFYCQQPPPIRYYQLSVGWADSALIMDNGMTIGIDTGNTGGAMINRLLAEGRDLDALIVTHLHTDHAGGVEAILDAGIAIHQVYLPVDYEKHGYGKDQLAVVQRLKDEGIPIACLGAGDELTFHETTIDVLWPQAGHTREGIDPNDRSLAMLITLGNTRILTMGDNGNLYERYAEASADIVKVGHHGSRTSSGEAFLAAVSPTLAIMTVRASSQQPAESTLERFAAQNVQVLCTDETGEITIVPTQNGYRAYRYLPEDGN